MTPQPGDRVRLKARRWWVKQSQRVGVYVGESRDGQCDRVQWPDTTKPSLITKGFLEVVQEAIR